VRNQSSGQVVNDLSFYTHYTPVSQYEFHDETEEKRQELTVDPSQRPKKKFRVISPGTMRRKLEEKKKPKLSLQIATTAPRTPTRLSDFELLSNLKYGGYGLIRLARHVSSKKYYAMKTLLRSTVYKHAQVQHAQNEKQVLLILSQAQSVHNVRLFATLNDRHALYLVLEYVPGGELLTYIRIHGRFPASVAKFYGAEIVLALEYLHDRQIVYRDLKPENILIDLRGHIKLCEFGFARTLAIGERAYTMCGTPDYIAPEVIVGTGHGIAVDWWALGVLCFEMQAGYPPFAAQDTMTVFANIQQRSSRLQFPVSMEPIAVDFMRRLLEPDPAHRLGSSAQGVLQVKSHSWFKSEPVVSWDAFARRTVPPPIVPKFDSMAQNYVPVSDTSSERFVHDPSVQLPSDVEHFFNTF
jgi:protein kinase X